MLQEYAHLLGKRGLIDLREPQGVSILVTICDVKQSYGRLRYLIRPVAGDGQAWVSAERVLYGHDE